MNIQDTNNLKEKLVKDMNRLKELVERFEKNKDLGNYDYVKDAIALLLSDDYTYNHYEESFYNPNEDDTPDDGYKEIWSWEV